MIMADPTRGRGPDRLGERTWTDVDGPAPRTVLLPVGAIEQHGPHLPVAVDACINAGIVARALELVPADLPVTVLPLLPVGKSDEHLAFPGTITVSAETLIRAWTEIGGSVHRAGCRKLVFLNSHGGNVALIDIGRLGPQVVPACAVNEVNRDAQLIACRSHAAGNHQRRFFAIMCIGGVVEPDPPAHFQPVHLG